jgi:hypothetical protein
MFKALAGPRWRIGALLIGAGICLRVLNMVLLRESASRVALDLGGVLAESLVRAIVMFVSYCAAAYCFRKTRGSPFIDFFNLLAVTIFGRAISGFLYFLVLRFTPVYALTFVPFIAAFVLVGMLLVAGTMGGVALLLRHH